MHISNGWSTFYVILRKAFEFPEHLGKKLFFNICEFIVTRSRCFGGKLRITMTMAPRGV